MEGLPEKLYVTDVVVSRRFSRSLGIDGREGHKLDEGQRQKVLFAFDDETQRAKWFNFPVAVVPLLRAML
jgi:hypothetical protein